MNIIVAGGTGLVGGQLLRQLARRSDLTTTALVRKLGVLKDEGIPAVREHLFTYDASGAYEVIGTGSLPCDVLLIALGTTMRKAGSKAAFRAVDLDYPVRLATSAAVNNPSVIIGVVSSIGADRPTGFYLRTKHEMEQALRGLGVPCVIARPSLLLGDRSEQRLGEQLGGKILPSLFAATERLGLSSALRRYRPISATQVATALIGETIAKKPAGLVEIEGERFYAETSVVTS